MPLEPPAWLAAQMKDPWSGEEARELWNGVLQARQEAVAYREVFATPQDARALKELYPGGVSEARATAERARVLDDIDRAYFGAAGKSAEETSASRAQLAAMMMREEPAAFREMVFAGLRAIEESDKGIGGGATRGASPTPTAARTELRGNGDRGTLDTAYGTPGNAQQAQVAAYVAFEKAANEELERSVGGAIERTLEQALPNISNRGEATTVGGRTIVPLHERLSAAVRQDVEQALKGDRQLSEQIAQILSARRFDGETRAQVVRLIDERARQLVPVAAKRALNEWTQTTLAAHRSRTGGSEAASTRREVTPASSEPRSGVALASVPAGSSANARAAKRPDASLGATRPDARRIDYRKLSDEQILEL